MGKSNFRALESACLGCLPDCGGHSLETMPKCCDDNFEGAAQRMGTIFLTRHKLACLVFCIFASLLQACGGGSSRRGLVAASPTPGPVPTPTLAPVHISQGGNLAAAISAALPGSIFIVAPGSYGPVTFPPDDRGPITVFADVTAQLSPESMPGAVVIDANDGPVALDISGQSAIVIDGLTVRGATDAGIRVSGCNNVTIQNATVKHNAGDGIRFEDSAVGTVFDNLIFRNAGSGIRTVGTRNLRAINNTVTENGFAGIFIGVAGDPSSAILLENNIVYDNSPYGIAVVASDAEGNFNLNTDGYVGIDPGRNDLTKENIPNLNPLFRSPDRVYGEDVKFFLSIGSPAINAGNPYTDYTLLEIIQPFSCPTAARCDRVTQVDGAPDSPPVDLGFHYPDLVLPTPTPTGTATSTRQSTLPRPTQTRPPTLTPVPTFTSAPTRTPR